MCVPLGNHIVYLNNVQAGGSCSAHVDGDGFDQSTFSKVLDLLGHGGTEEQRLSLTLYHKSQPL